MGPVLLFTGVPENSDGNAVNVLPNCIHLVPPANVLALTVPPASGSFAAKSVVKLVT